MTIPLAVVLALAVYIPLRSALSTEGMTEGMTEVLDAYWKEKDNMMLRFTQHADAIEGAVFCRFLKRFS